MKVLFLSRYAENGASSRCRSYQLIPGLQNAGVSCTVSPLFGRQYLETLYNRGSTAKKVLIGIAGLMRRLFCSLRLASYDVVVIEKECIPHLPFWLERVLLLGAKRIVSDYDDAVWVTYEGSFLLREKIRKIIRCSDTVVVGSAHLEEYAKQANPQSVLVPTVVDVGRYPVRLLAPETQDRAIVIGWIGTPVTAKFLSVVREPLRRIAKRRRIVFRCVGGGDPFDIPGVLIRRLPWTLDSEVEQIGQMDIGIMPLTDDAFSRGKCGYKLIQYMAAGLPTVASDVGENRHIIVEGETGFLTRAPEDWEPAIEKLCASYELRQKMGAAGRQRVVERYDLSHAVSAYAKILKALE